MRRRVERPGALGDVTSPTWQVLTPHLEGPSTDWSSVAVRPLLVALTTIVTALLLLSATVLTLSPLTETELGLGLTAGVWSVAAGLALHLVAERSSDGPEPTSVGGERVLHRQ